VSADVWLVPLMNNRSESCNARCTGRPRAEPGRRFHALHDKVHRRDVLERAWKLVRANRGAAGIDGETINDVERYGVSQMLDELAEDLREGRWRPAPARRVFIEKPGRAGELRPLSIPTVRDRVVQAATKLVIEPVFEADFLSCSFGFRPKRSAHDALQVLIDESWKGKRWVVETDIASCFEAIPHDQLMLAVRERIIDRRLLGLLRAMLNAGVMTDATVTRHAAGTPQGGVVSPVLCNVYLHRIDRRWQHRDGVLVRYADDLLVMCRTRSEAERALRALTALLADLGLAVKQAKTRIVQLREGGDGVDFLGFHHRIVRVRNPRFRHVTFLSLAYTPEDAAGPQSDLSTDGPSSAAASGRAGRQGDQRLPARLRGVLSLRQLLDQARPDQPLRGRTPRAVRGQAPQARARPRLATTRRLAQPHGADRSQWNHRRPQTTGLAGQAECRPVKNVGEPCAGEPHARFDAAAGGNQHQSGQHGRAVPSASRRPYLDPTRPR
jgi:RNA-directed DNA polymerase